MKLLENVSFNFTSDKAAGKAEIVGSQMRHLAYRIRRTVTVS